MEKAYELLKTILSNDFGAFGIVVAFLLFVFWAYGKILKIIHDHGDIVKRMDKIEGTIDAIKSDVVEIKGDIGWIKNNLNILMSNAVGSPVHSKSPLSLNEKGRKMFADMDVDAILAKNWESRILPTLSMRLSSKNPYDIQQYCIERTAFSPEEFFDADSIDKIKLYAYKSGTALIFCYQVFGISIRDSYLKHIGLDAADIDKYDPGKTGKL